MQLEIKNLTKVFDKVLDDDRGQFKGLQPTSFQVDNNELVAIVGHNGAGKSTLLKAIGQWLVPDSGQILLNGQNIRRQKKWLNHISFVPEVPNLYDFFSIDYNLKFFALLFDQPLARIDLVLEQMQLNPFRKHKVQSLSKGLKQRVNISRSLIADPAILLLDEPTSGLDFEMTREVYKMMRKMNQQGKTILFTTHQPEEIRDLATRILALHRGAVVFDGIPNDYFSSPIYNQIRQSLHQ
jgi:ABC-2 type transport system ATP-binding protein